MFKVFYICSFVYLAFTLISINSQGLRGVNRRQSVFHLIKKQKYDITFLQETHWTDELQTDILREWKGQILFNNFNATARGTAILFHPNFSFQSHHDSCDSQGRSQQILIECGDRKFNLVNIYAPGTDTERRNYFVTLSAYLSATEGNILGGDFNCISDIILDKQGGNPLARQSAATILHTITSHNNLVDIWREQHRDVRKYTWTGRHPHDNSYIHTRIDKFYVSLPLTNLISHTDIVPFPFSDHDAILLTINLQQQPRGTGYWLFNKSLLDDQLFNTEINNFWTVWLTKKNNFPTLLQWWDKAKQHFKNISIQRSSTLRKNERAERRQLENKLQRLQDNITNDTHPDAKAYLQAKVELQQLHQRELDAVKIRTQIKFAEEGEKSTRYFYSLERRNQTQQAINVLTKDNLDTVTEAKDIITEVHNFYRDLYSSEPVDQHKQDMFLEINMPQLSPNDRDTCEGYITEEELNKALRSMESNKSPGFDGITTDFYKHFWPILGQELANILNFAYDNGSLALSQRRGIISLIFKKEDRTKLKNWRPITLLNTDYKILTKALANRLQRILPLLIHTDQTACIPGRTINDNIRLIHDAINYANEKQTPLAVISVDQLKAFDRVSHDYLFAVLRHFGFGPSFLRWIRLLYTGTMSSVKVNGWLTAFIPIQRGLRQGCALSMPLYVLTAELLALHIRSNVNIKGLSYPKSMVKLTQYADDTTLFLVDDVSIVETFKTFDLYEQASGAKINVSKCKGLWSGSLIDRTDTPTNFNWYNDQLPDKILGLYVGNVDCTMKNVEHKINTIKNTIAAWKHRDLSLKGRALVINGLLTSRLWFHAINISIPDWAVTEIETLIYEFLWNYKRPLLNRDILSLPLAEGGLNIPRIAVKIRAFRVNTLRRLLDADQAHWKFFTAYFLRPHNLATGKHTLCLSYTAQQIDRTIPAFHKELLISWLQHSDYHSRIYPPVTLPDILQEPLFQNPLLHNPGFAFQCTEWIRAGITRVADLCYVAIPGFLPILVIHELLTGNTASHRTLHRTRQEFLDILNNFPQRWIRLIHDPGIAQTATLQPCFAIKPANVSDQPLQLHQCKTKHFYAHLLHAEKIAIPSLNYWQHTLSQPPNFDASFWKATYPILATNKQGDVNWKVSHRILPSALSLFRGTVYHTPNCHSCHVTENIEHIFLHCPATTPLWTSVQTYINKLTNNTLNLDDNMKLFGLSRHRHNTMNTRTYHLINWLLTIARCAIHKSAVDYRTRQEISKPEDILLASIKAHLKFQFKAYKLKGVVNDFASDWCLGLAFATIRNNTIVFTV